MAFTKSIVRTHERIEMLYGNTYHDIVIRINDHDNYHVDPHLRMTFTTRQYIANMVAAAIKLGRSFNNVYDTPPLEQLKLAVEVLVERVPPAIVSELLDYSVTPTDDQLINGMAGPMLLEGWNADPDWLTME